MKYVRVQVVFPKSLLAEIPKYVQGELVYIPKSPANYIERGADTGAKNVIAQRNESIFRAVKTGTSIPKLAEFYCLSEETIKKIVYRKN